MSENKNVIITENEIVITEVDIGLIRILQCSPDLVASIESDSKNPLNNLLWDLRVKAIILKKKGEF